jgi:CBS domain-containing protein
MVTATRSLPELQLQMVNAGASASQIGLAIASVADAITSRLCQLAEERIGPPPVPYVWLAAGSQARREQLINADQDSALIIDNGYDEALHGEWFRRLGDSVCAGMEASGLRYCPGEVMACNQQWRQPLRQWRRYFEDWIDRPLRKSLMYASNFFDMRPIYGEQRLFAELHQQILEQVRNNGIFLAHLAANAVRTRPPLGFFRDFVLTEGGDHVRGVDLKTGGVIPVVDLARIYALAGGISEVGTLERLRRSVVYGTLSERGAGELEGAWILINTLRARHQADAIRRGELVGNSVIPETLSPLDRRHLKDAFGVIKGYQEALAQAYQTDRFF